MKALYWHWEDGNVRCELCPHACLVPERKKGLCLVRENVPGEGLIASTYGLFSSIALDPMEKKPLYHFLPGRDVLSLGSVGCNMRCPFCQNWHISTWSPQIKLSRIDPPELLSLVKKYSVTAVAFTYNEPLISYEYLLEVIPLLKKENVKVVLVTNGLINPLPLKEIAHRIDAANVDLKTFNEETYKKLGGDLETVLKTLQILKSFNVHVEITHLMVTGINDDLGEFEALCSWIAGELGDRLPLHISRYFPSHKWTKPPTDISLLERALEIAKRYLEFAYLGNVSKFSHTFCPSCGKLVIKRRGYKLQLLSVTSDGRCSACGFDLGIVLL
ncbi:AmmeMemoRadiSam system radical SAM enzyme [Acetomicrobium hydrogeniformans]|uniref:Radical SAM domain protein n=1 Tax=Acetomicrobium hydrogeniformans ATCC BAA-1850 TaxID=592015 RepID=A0A0T5XCI8_9BACT|nr:AmmeMemoRadiSam system radical SAM enzyme [Acetomicrobium hydrogeniformans]KRT36041.1 radical SAM domain protein [Acetomicrobium hydrogeniformans ATCC BAA-1850]